MNDSRDASFGRMALAAALLAATTMLVLAIAGGATFPDYSHASRYISELGARGAPHAGLVNFAGFLPAGIFVTAFALLAWKALPRSTATSIGLLGIAVFGLGYLVAAFHPCEPGCRSSGMNASQRIHEVFGLAGYVTAPIALGLFGRQALGWPDGRVLSVLSFAAAGASLVGLLLLSPKFAYSGAAQRLLEASVLAWMVACGLYARRGRQGADPQGAIEFETDRLVVRRWVADNLRPLLAVYGDARAMRWVGDGRPLSEADAVRWLAVTATNYRVRGYGMFAVVLRGSGRVVGFCGLVHPGGQTEPEVKYAFAREHWGKGYATEVVSALLAHGDRRYALVEIVATVAAEHAASQAVLAKAGMRRRDERVNEDGSVTAIYAWRSGRSPE